MFGVEAARPISPISVGDRVLVTDPRPIPSSAVPVRGKEGFFAEVESDSVMLAALADDVDRFSDFDVDEDREVDVLATGGADPEAVVQVAGNLSRLCSVSGHQAAGSCYGRVCVFCFCTCPFLSSQLQAGHLELRSQQQGVGGGEEKEKQSGQGRELVQAAQPADKEGEGEVVPPDIPDDDSLFGLNLLGESGGAAALASFLAREGEQQGSRETEGVQEAQDDKKV
uniref:Uncharacterized protein n=1 Tax=Chromera velia CCMP2878 TaxID=1169474 RepID=A0A0G4I4E0_9ALVE|eukprot:Cvel_10898.t1-p1 / transcript=Cvel_10898.t1 / gene=Cvel_10898 / organism=Chromera_velia_CCMP2878 / gene_product=hypothetical protein / transcript_product=hypothetical protein / location=Cvel_scaffold669:3363-4174(+) / protein_length=225 / sequence_SO=supercontig / SO=protein_coding / is_pseudo=false